MYTRILAVVGVIFCQAVDDPLIHQRKQKLRQPNTSLGVNELHCWSERSTALEYWMMPKSLKRIDWLKAPSEKKYKLQKNE